MKKYTIWAFLFDLFMITITGGLWLVWIVLKFFRSKQKVAKAFFFASRKLQRL